MGADGGDPQGVAGARASGLAADGQSDAGCGLKRELVAALGGPSMPS
jgi:hypothetical protein